MTARPDPDAARRRAAVLAATEPVRSLASAGALAAFLPLLQLAPGASPIRYSCCPG